MSILDKFNNWYVRSIPETETGIVITWLEPAAGARYRWKANRHLQILWVPLFFLMVWLLPSKSRGYDGYSLESRFWLAVVATPLFGLLIWFVRGARERITLSTQRVIIGQGRGQRRIHLDESPLSLEKRDGYTVLIVREPDENPKRIYLDPEKEVEILALLTKAGWLKADG